MAQARTTLGEVMAMHRMDVPRAEVILSKVKAAEYALHSDTKYLLCFENSLHPEQIQALKLIFEGSGRNVYVICGGEEPKVFSLHDETVKFPTQRMFLEEM